MGSIRPFNAPWCSPHALELLRRTNLASGARSARLNPRPDCGLRCSAPSVATLARKRPCSSRTRVRHSARRRRSGSCDGRGGGLASTRTSRRTGCGTRSPRTRSIGAPRRISCMPPWGTAASRHQGSICTHGRRRVVRSTWRCRPSGTHDKFGYLAFE